MTDKTRLLYRENSHLYEFEAAVTEIVRRGGSSLIALDKTAFFPGGGGQLSDSGRIGEAKIDSAFEENGVIYHKTESGFSFKTGDRVFCRTDAPARFRRMQAHSGEHIVSGLAHTMYGADNIGFHMDSDCVMTVDFNIPLSREQLSALEKEANERVYRNLPVRAYTVNGADAAKIAFRSKKEIKGDIRIIDIAETDACACCAPHVDSTGEIGLIKILSAVSHRSGVRLTLVCGGTAYEDYRDKYRQLMNICRALCAGHGEADEAVRRLSEQNSALKREAARTKTRLNEYLASSVPPASVICAFFDGLSMQDLFEVTDFLKPKCEYAAAVFSGSDKNGYAFCLYSRCLDAVKLSSDIKRLLGGSCGGRGDIIQGFVAADREGIYKFFEEEGNKHEDA